MDCRVRLAQIDTHLGDISANLAVHLEHIDEALKDGIQLLVFPELSLTGYFLKDQTYEVALSADAEALTVLAERSKEISIVAGYVERKTDGRVYNAIALFEDGRIKHIHRKVHLVSYGMFEESRDLAAGEDFHTAFSKYGRIGFLTCEDAWHVDGAYLYFLDGVDAIVICSAGPGRGVTGTEGELSSNRTWRTLQDALALFFRSWILYCNRVGWEDGVVFGGHSRVVDPHGAPVDEQLGLDPATLDVSLSRAELDRARIQTPLRRDERPWIFAKALNDRLDTWVGQEEEE
ncbi:MAG: carbon-nitrogen hydrolase [Planctomycetota bacterium]|nr:carbon-nitrogen hydrolase [Planctomycetota bacterium]